MSGETCFACGHPASSSLPLRGLKVAVPLCRVHLGVVSSRCECCDGPGDQLLFELPGGRQIRLCQEHLAEHAASLSVDGSVPRAGRRGRKPAVPDEVAARILDERSRGATFRAIADGLNEDGVPTAHGGVRWWENTVRQVIERLTA